VPACGLRVSGDYAGFASVDTLRRQDVEMDEAEARDRTFSTSRVKKGSGGIRQKNVRTPSRLPRRLLRMWGAAGPGEMTSGFRGLFSVLSCPPKIPPKSRRE